jgi:hypothetical protein
LENLLNIEMLLNEPLSEDVSTDVCFYLVNSPRWLFMVFRLACFTFRFREWIIPSSCQIVKAGCCDNYSHVVLQLKEILSKQMHMYIHYSFSCFPKFVNIELNGMIINKQYLHTLCIT